MISKEQLTCLVLDRLKEHIRQMVDEEISKREPEFLAALRRERRRGFLKRAVLKRKDSDGKP